MTDTTIGIDISKDTLDVHRLPSGESRVFANDRTGHRALLKWIGRGVERVVYEPTGRYHRALERTLDQAGLPLVKVNPLRARRFAESYGQLAKTDARDAAMLARMGVIFDLSPRPVADKRLDLLRELYVARTALIKDRTAAKNRAQGLTIAVLKKQNAQRLAQIKSQLEAIEAEIVALIAKDADLVRKCDILLSIPGIAMTTATAMIIEMPELGALGGKQIAALAGVAPFVRESGKWKGKAKIKGGRASLRHALYMPALVATRCNPDLEAKYRHLIAKGKPAKLAITAVMRKLLTTANALIRDDRTWTETIA